MMKDNSMISDEERDRIIFDDDLCIVMIFTPKENRWPCIYSEMNTQIALKMPLSQVPSISVSQRQRQKLT